MLLTIITVLCACLIGSLAAANSIKTVEVLSKVLRHLRTWWTKKRVCGTLMHIGATYYWEAGTTRVLYLVVREHDDFVYEKVMEVDKRAASAGIEIVVRAHQGRLITELVPPGSQRIF